MAMTQNAQRYSSYVHYFCHVDSGKLVYPNQTEENYSSYGSFYIVGDFISKSYVIHAYDNGQLIELALIQDESSPRFFVAAHSKYGKFVFHSEKVKHWNLKVTYNQKDYRVLIRLRPWNESKFESVCQQHNFYVVGFANLSDDEE